MGDEMTEPRSLAQLNELRREAYHKDQGDEAFLRRMNEALVAVGLECYREYPERHPLLFIFGLPRSGTTLLTQTIAHCLYVGYINNLVARFWLTPITGIRLSKILLGDRHYTDYESQYARTAHLSDIHEFGYFWRHWLKKKTVADLVNATEKEDQIDWSGLKRVLLNMQHEFGTAMVFKNMFGAYHIEAFLEMLAKAVFVYVERDPLDTAISILDARRAFYGDPSVWWSSYPPEYNRIEDWPAMQQVAGQVHYLRRFYDRQITGVDRERIVQVSYRDLCQNPSGVLQTIQQACVDYFDYRLALRYQPPQEFGFSHYSERTRERETLQEIFRDIDRKRL
ncbi:MAG: sulfotransferase [bacterium]